MPERPVNTPGARPGNMPKNNRSYFIRSPMQLTIIRILKSAKANLRIALSRSGGIRAGRGSPKFRKNSVCAEVFC
jgi:hypothetical protein